MVIDDNFYMSLAINEAWKYQGLTYPNPPVGTVILDKNAKLISINTHKKVKTSHAELNALIDAYIKITKDEKILNFKNPNEQHKYLLENHNNYFKDFIIYVTLEPCNHQGSTPPCSLLIEKLGFKRVIIATFDPNKKATGSIKRFKKIGIDIKVGVLEQEAKTLLLPFIKYQNGDNFIFFKIAKHQNGTYDGGLVSSFESRKYVHKLRDKIDLLVIGGESVRVDKPTLDARMVNGKAPDVLIYSKRDDFDKSIPLFNIPNRKVFIESDFEKLQNYKFIMIEGGEKMLEATKGIVDWYLFFTSPNLKIGKTLQTNLNLQNLFSFTLIKDTITWAKPILENIK